MAKKRKGGPNRSKELKSNEPVSGSKLFINSYEDVADSEDEFHINRDKILLDEGPVTKKQRRLEEDDEFLQSSEEEVLAVPSSASVSDEEDESDNELDKTDKYDQPDGDEYPDEASDPEGDLDKAGWGTSRRDYYDADVIETEADALEEEEEALRLQKKQLQGMTEADFGFDESEWLDAGKADKEGSGDEGPNGVIEEVLPQIEITDDMPLEEQSRILTARYPEFDPLAKEFLALQNEYEQLRLNALATQKMQDVKQAKNGSLDSKPPGDVIRWTALSTYLSALSMYFAILTSGRLDSEGMRQPKEPSKMRDHPIMESLIRSRATWHKVKNAKFPEPVDGAQADAGIAPTTSASNRASEDLLSQHSTQAIPQEKKIRKSKAKLQAEKALAEAEAQRAERLRNTEADLARISRRALRGSSQAQPDSAAAHNTTIQAQEASDDLDFGEPPASQSADNARRKKSLQFYTSQIAQKANRRAAAGRDTGGDADIPYRERLKDRQARLNAQAEARGRKKAAPPGDSSADEEDMQVAAEMRIDADGGEEDQDYYQTIASRTAAKKADRAARKEAAREAAIRGASVTEVETVGPDGKRAITYAIEKNKGLTPRRKKDVRNPRVKKRKKFEDKMKKLGSVRRLYKGGEGRGGYAGETSGIKSGLVRSVKL